MKIFAAGLATETNTFSPIPTGVEDFLVQRGAERARGQVSHPSLDLTAVWGEQATAHGDDLVFSLNAWAEPAGVTTRAAYESLRDELLEDLQAAMPVDVVLLMLHGAMVAHGYENCEEDLVDRVRAIVGPAVVIGVELDLHCHMTPALIQSADIVVTFKEYPHVDINDRAHELFELARATKLGEIRPTTALFDCEMIGFYPTSRQPLRGLVDEMIAMERARSGVLSLSFCHSFPFADLPKVGARMLAVTDNDPILAASIAREFGLRVHTLRREIGFDSISLPLEVALSKALASPRKPVVVADQSDNVGAGGPGDATFALRWLLDHNAQHAALAIFYDPEVVRIAKKAGVGTRLPVRLGGKLTSTSGSPIDMEVEVTAIRENYMHARPQQSGEPLWSPLGDVAALRTGTIDVIVASKRCQCYCPSIFAEHGIDISQKQLLIPKSTQHFYSAFSKIASEVIYMAGPGAAPTDPRQIPYRRLDLARMYPWSDKPLSA